MSSRGASANIVRASVIIPVWNGLEYLPACLDALLAQESVDFEVILVDNASTDGSADWIENYVGSELDIESRLRLIRNRDNLGFAGACNVGLEAARGEVLVLVNQDTRVHPGWLDALVAPLSRPEVGVVGCKALYPDGTIQHAGAGVEWPLGLVYHRGRGEQDTGQWDVSGAVEYVTGAAMAFRRDVLAQVGLLDEGFWPGYYEDADFCLTARELGYKVWYVPDAVFVHNESTSVTDAAAISLALERGRLRFVLKHLAPSRFLQEFVPAERRHHLRAARGRAGHIFRMAYLEAIPVAASLLARRWRADVETIDGVLGALQQLYMRTYAVRHPTDESDLSFDPVLQEFNFESSVPVIGPLIARVRSLWYSVAARWAVRYLAAQQEAINRRLQIVHEQQEIANQLTVRSLVALSREMARVLVQARVLSRLEPGCEGVDPEGETDAARSADLSIGHQKGQRGEER